MQEIKLKIYDTWLSQARPKGRFPLAKCQADESVLPMRMRNKKRKQSYISWLFLPMKPCFFALLKHLGNMCFSLHFYIADNCTCQVVILVKVILVIFDFGSGHFAHYNNKNIYFYYYSGGF